MAAGVPGRTSGTPAHETRPREPADDPAAAAAPPHPDPREPATPTVGPPALARILVVEDEPAMLRALRINLRVRGYEVTTARTGTQALTEAGRRPPGAVILDLGLPDVDGIEVIRGLRGWSRAAVIALSGRTSSGDKIAALDAGADDYVTKPFSMEELLARLRAALRRDDGTLAAAKVTIGRCVIDLAAHSVLDQGKPVHLTRTEWRLLEILLSHPGQLMGTTFLLTEIWGPGYERNRHYLRFHLAGLRRKLEANPARPRHLLTEPGMGYRFQP